MGQHLHEIVDRNHAERVSLIIEHEQSVNPVFEHQPGQFVDWVAGSAVRTVVVMMS